ncbi:MAG: hypothetical protein MJ062_00885 [Oscillospiraceae bacterium]|nr:hypothetical protein [Oscillospiraceae bacterium]
MTKRAWIDTAVCIFAAGGLLIGGGMVIGSCTQQIVTADSQPEETTLQNAAVSTHSPADEQPLRAASTPEGPYLLRLEGSTLSVYQQDEDIPFEQYAVSPAWLPDYDRLLLEHGIEAHTAAELRRLIEDYLS